jgi:DNA-binding transcriptional regulator YiaG
MARYNIITRRQAGSVEANTEEAAIMKYRHGRYTDTGKAEEVRAIAEQDISEAIKEYRQWNELTQAKMARMVGVTKMQIIRWEHKTSKPNNLSRQKLKELGII